MEQKDALTVLLTGRSEEGFTELLKKMVASRGLGFDMVVLKPKAGPNNQRFSSTMAFKQVYLETLVETYKGADEIRVYEDRPKHTKGFRDFFTDYNKRQNGIGGVPTRGPIVAEVVQVADGATLLDPVVETAEVQRLINDHNAAVDAGKTRRQNRFQIKKTVFYTGYLITNADTQKLLTLAQIPPNMPDTELKYLANNVLITPRPCPNSILEKVGGMGNKLLWEVTGTAAFENKIWAVAVQPVPRSAKYYTENPAPIVVLALRKGARPIDAGKIQNWQPVPADKALIFETTVGEKVLLRIEDEDPKEGEYESLFPNKSNKRKHTQETDSPNRSASGQYGQQKRDGFNGRGRGQGTSGGNRGSGRGNRGSGNRSGNHGGGAGRGGRGRGGRGYRSLDDVAPANGTFNQNQQGYTANVAMTYDDFPPLQNPEKSYAQQQPQQQGNFQQQGYQQQPYQQTQQPVQQFQQYQQQYQQYPQYQQQPAQGQAGKPNPGMFY
jgi:uncharacterized membrane protein YgcG